MANQMPEESWSQQKEREGVCKGKKVVMEQEG